MTTERGVAIVGVPVGERSGLEVILEESFDGWYLRHSKGTLQDVEIVRAAMRDDTPVGLVMLKNLAPGVGYVFYIAVAKARRRKGVAGKLLDDALGYFRASGVKEVFASVEEDNEPSEKLFVSQGFTPTSFGEVSKTYGKLRAINMYRMMRVVPGEVLLHKIMSSVQQGS